MRIAIEGCAHGELEKIYNVIEALEKDENIKIDLLICCGDFQATRNLEDLQTMAVPKKYQDMCSFYKYYSGEKTAPILTIFIGGNHEASNHLQELPYGGWVAPNIYYLGYANVVKVNGIRIGGLSGIYKGHDFLRGRYEFSPYNEATKRSVYHIRQLDVFRLKQLSGGVDVFLSHDWPRGIHNHGDTQKLLQAKPYFRDEVDSNKLGSPPCEDLLKLLKPFYWFSAHMHCKFAAIVRHGDSKMTKFLALDKCLPRRRFLQILEVENGRIDDGEIRFEYDLEWLTILYLTNHLISTKNTTNYMPGPSGAGRYNFTPTPAEKEIVLRKLGYDLRIPSNFCQTVEPYNPKDVKINPQQPRSQINPQTTQFCDTLGIDDPLSIALLISGHDLNNSSKLDGSGTDSSVLSQSGDQSSCNSSYSQTSPLKRKPLSTFLPKPKVENNPEEVVLEDEEKPFKWLNKTSDTSSDSSAIVSVSEMKPEIKVECSTPPVKKFRRRNQIIYTSQDESK